MKNAKDLEKNKFKINSNPFKRKIVYGNWNYSTCDWNVPAETSDFRKPEFTDAALYHKAYDIIKTAQESYAGNVGLEIYFEGTPEEFNTISEIKEKYFQDSELDIIKGNNYLLPVKEVKRDIDHIFKDLIDMFSESKSNSATEQIKKYEDVMSDTIPICIMGLYSTGKSAFINSLLGVEILPSADDPTTAKTFKISIGPKYTDYSIQFYYQDEKVEKTIVKIGFKGNKFSFNCDKNIGIVSELDKIGKYDSAYDRMYYALSIINSYDKEYRRSRKPGSVEWRVSPLIEVTIPLEKKYTVLPIDEYDFVIYDTPGSDANKGDDIKVLKEAMTGQTNGLPIYVVTSEQMDKQGHSDLIAILNELGDALDRNNLMIAVNKADDPDTRTLASKKNSFDDLAVSDLNPAGTYFVSSIMGLGSKLLMTNRFDEIEDIDEDTGDVKNIKKPRFIDPHYGELFRKNKKDFVRKQEAKSLYLYNIIPVPEYDKYIKNVHDGEINERILYNSGLHAIGSAITDFADSYSLYNKCRNAGEYLSKALEYLNEEIENKKAEKTNLSIELNSNMSEAENKLFRDMNDVASDEKKKADFSFADSLSKKNMSNKNELKSKISPKAQEIIKNLKRFEFNKKEKFTIKMKAFLEQLLSSHYSDCKEIAEHKWPDVQTNMKDALIKIIVSSPTLTQEQKEIIKDKIETIDVTPAFSWNINIVPKEIVSGILIISVNEKALIAKCEGIFDTETSRSNGKLRTDWSDSIDKLRKELINEAQKCISEHNPTLKEYQAKISQCSNDIKFLDNQKDIINSKIKEISELTEFKIKDDSED